MKASIILCALTAAFGVSAAPFFGKRQAASPTPAAPAAPAAPTAAIASVIGVQSIIGTRTEQIVVKTQVPQVQSLVVTRVVETPTVFTTAVVAPTQIVSQVAESSQTVIAGAPVMVATASPTVVYGIETLYSTQIVPTVVTSYITRQVPYTVQTSAISQVQVSFKVAPTITAPVSFTVPTVVPGTTIVNQVVPTQTQVVVVGTTPVPPSA
ncbi:hypothetical protein HDU87_002321 [Geranomyces variabilis]|uniref:Uncharacterized protein n=1 Tax=Geranomyces variabilis TaxID=109894 RepID=A0AAD5TLE1_9FUNG|nr:hypothetical protein HDU87_002321 [Geranomyces variabilis]